MSIQRTTREVLTEQYEEAHATEKPENPELTQPLEAAQTAADVSAKALDPEELVQEPPTLDNDKKQAMNHHQQAIQDLYEARSSGDPDRVHAAEQAVHSKIEAGQARELFTAGCGGQGQSQDPVLHDIFQEVDRASRVENMRELSGEDLHAKISDANEQLRKGVEREQFNDVIQERNAALLVMRERADNEQVQRVRTKDMARAVGRFEPDGPQGYRAESAPESELRATRDEAVEDQVRWLDRPEQYLRSQSRDRDEDQGVEL